MDAINTVNPVALVTGGSRGIGRGIALALSEMGFDLVINFVSNHAAARQTAQECVARAKSVGRTQCVKLIRADISKAADRRRLIQQTRDTFGRLDLLVNNAGIAPQVRCDLLEATEKSLDRLLGTNLKGPFFLTQLAARWMLESREVRRSPPLRPKIIFITSISAYTASVQRGDYCITKAGLAMLTPLFATRLAEQGIQVFEIRPGIIKTDMTSAVEEKYTRLIQSGLTPIARWGQPDDIARAVCAIAQDCFPFSTGEVLNVDGGFHLRRL